MGISGLLPALKDIQVPCNISDYKGKKLAVDGYVWLHKGAFGCAEDIVKGRKTTKFVDYAMHRVRMMRHYGVTPLLVFDGGPLPAKKGTESSRAKSRAEWLARAQSLEAQGRLKDARDCYTKCLDVTPEHAYQLIKALRAENVDYIVAPYEADPQLCYLEREGYVDGIITEDSDLLVFGCKHVIFKLEKDGSCISIDRSKLATIRDLPMHGWTDTEFRRMAMLSGCDYLPSIPGIGLKKAHKMLRRYKTVEKFLQAIRLEGSHNVPATYLADFAQAELAFIHQRVFEPTEQRLIPLNPFPASGLGEADEQWIGLDIDEKTARGIAKGDMHPETRLPIEDLYPDYKPGTVGNPSRAKPIVLGESSKSNPKVSGGPLDAFFSRVKRTKSAPMPLPTPVGVFGSGPKRLSDLGGYGWRASNPVEFHAHAENEMNNIKAVTTKASKFFSRSGGKSIAKASTNSQVSMVNEEMFEIAWEKDATVIDIKKEGKKTQTPVIEDESQGINEEVVGGVAVDKAIENVLDIESHTRFGIAKSSRSPSPEHLRSPTPVQFRSPSPVVSPPNLSSPIASPASIPFTTPPRSSPPAEVKGHSSPCSAKVLVAASSQFLQPFNRFPSFNRGPPASSIPSTLVPNDSIDNFKPANVLVPQSSPLTGTKQPSSSAVGEFGEVDLRDTLKIGVSIDSDSSSNIENEPPISVGKIKSKKRVASDMAVASSDSIDDEVIVTPSMAVAGCKRSRQRRSSSSVDAGDGVKGSRTITHEADQEMAAVEAEEEAKREQRAKVVAQGWRMKYALNSALIHSGSGSPVAGNGSASKRGPRKESVGGAARGDRVADTPESKVGMYSVFTPTLTDHSKSTMKRASVPLSAMRIEMGQRMVLQSKSINITENTADGDGLGNVGVTPSKSTMGKVDMLRRECVRKGDVDMTLKRRIEEGLQEREGEKVKPLGLTCTALERFRYNRV